MARHSPVHRTFENLISCYFLPFRLSFFCEYHLMEGESLAFYIFESSPQYGIQLIWAHQEHQHFFTSSKRVTADFCGVNLWTKSTIRHVARRVITFRIRRNFAIRQRSNSSRRLPSLTCRVSVRCVAHFTHCIYFDALHVLSTWCVFGYACFWRVVHTSSIRRAYLFDASCISLRRVVHISSTRRIARRRAVHTSSTRRVALRRVAR